MKVLVIEDDPDVIETITSVLTSFFTDVEIQKISHGDQFRRGLWKEGRWSVVILDLMIPGMTGFDVCERLRAYPSTRDVPILALTGYDTLQNEERIKAAGASRYLAKPFEVKEFLSEVRLLTGEAT